MSSADPDDGAVTALNDHLVADAVLQPHHRRLVERLAWPVQARIAAICARDLRATELSGYWTTVLEPPRRARPLWTAFGLLTAALLGGLLVSGFVRRDSWTAASSDFWSRALSQQVFASEIIIMVAMFTMGVALSDKKAGHGADFLMLLGFLDLLLIVAMITAEVVLGTFYAAHRMGWSMTAGGLFIVILAIVVLARLARRRTVQMRNPFRYCLDADDRELRGRTSVIAR